MKPFLRTLLTIILTLFLVLLVNKYIQNIQNILVLFLTITTFLADFLTIYGFFSSRDKTNIKSSNEYLGPHVNNDWRFEKYYTEFIGRIKYRQDLISNLSSSSEGPKTILVYSFGGMGKTALCRQVVEDLYNNNVFKNIIWLQNKTDSYDFSKDTFENNIPKYLNYESLLNDIVAKSGISDGLPIDIGRTETKLYDLFRKYRFLFVVDGIEETELSEKIFGRFTNLIPKESQTRILLNSRSDINIPATHVKLDPFSEAESIQFINSFRKEQPDIFREFNFRDSEIFTKILKSTHGNPLLIKMFLSQLKILDFDDLLERFNEFKFQGLNENIFSPSWKYLEEENPLSIEIMILLSRYPGGLDIFMIYDRFPNESKRTIENSLRALDKLSIIEIYKSQKVHKFNLHSYVVNFVLSQISNE